MVPAVSTPGLSVSRSREGSALLMVLVVLIIVTGLATVSLRNSLALMRISEQQFRMEQAHFAAESGVEAAAWTINTSAYMGGSVTEITHTLPNGASATVTITPLNSRGQAFSVASTSTVREVTRDVNVGRIYRPTYLDYGNFFEDFRDLWWIYGSIVDGKVWTGTRQNHFGYTRTNGQKWGPIFTALNETAASSYGGDTAFTSTLPEGMDLADYDYDDLQFWDEYPDGYQTGVPKPALLSVDFDEARLIAQSLNVAPAAIQPSRVHPDAMPKGRALLLEGKTEIRFDVEVVQGREVGIMEIRNQKLFGNFNWNKVYSEAVDLVYVRNLTSGPSGHRGSTLMLGDSVHHRPNILKGNLTIWAEDDITIPTHIIYDNQNLEESTDKLGVISRDDIWFDRKFSGDLVVQGGFIATGARSASDPGELGLIDYDKFGVRGTLYFLGSRVAQRVYPFGVFSGDRFLSGFITEHTFDWRFVTDPPPFTPVLSSEVRYEGWH